MKAKAIISMILLISITTLSAQTTGEFKPEKNTIVHFVVGKNKIGGSPLAEYQGIVKRDLDIDGVIKEEKITSYVQSDYDNKGVETAFGTIYTAKNTTSSKVALVPADANKYEIGVTEALNMFLEHHIKEFYSKFYR